MSSSTPQQRRRYREEYFFDNNREAVIQRDREKCVKCGMTREEHKAMFGRDITVDHIDGRGRHSAKDDKNNSLDNLQTLCLPCHSSKDNKLRKLTDVQVINIFHLRGDSRSTTLISKLYGVDRNAARQIHIGRSYRRLTGMKIE